MRPMHYLDRWSVVAAAVVAATLCAFSCAPQRKAAGGAFVMVQPLEEEALADTGHKEDPAQPVEKLIPATPGAWQKRPPCDEGMDERAINGACWQATSRRPPCGTLYHYEGICVRPIAKAKPQPVSDQ